MANRGVLLALKAKKQVNYVESDSEGENDDEEIFNPKRTNKTRGGNGNATKRRKTSPESDDDFEQVARDASDDGKPCQWRRHIVEALTYWCRNGRFYCRRRLRRGSQAI